MKIEDALYHAVHDYPGGVAELARRMGLASPTLYGMANPNEAGHGWTLKHIRSVLAFTSDKRPLHALCEESGGVFVPLKPDATSIDGMPEQLAKLAAEFGDVARAAQDAMRDGRITPRELAHFDSQIFELISEAANTATRLRQAAQQQPVRAVK